MNAVIYRRSAAHNEQWLADQQRLADQETNCRRYDDEHGSMLTGTTLRRQPPPC